MLTKKIHKLNVKLEQDFEILGISSHENDYRISWALNQFLGLRLVRSENHVTQDEKTGTGQEFITYTYNDPDNLINYKLLCNHSENGYLLPSNKTIDYVMLVSGEDYKSRALELSGTMKNIDMVNTVFMISDLSPKIIRRLIF